MPDGEIVVGAPGPRSCPACGAPATVPSPDSPRAALCPACGHQFLTEVPSAEERRHGYAEDYYRRSTGGRFLRPAELLVRAFRRGRMRGVLRREPRPATILDVGCGRGLLVELFAGRGWRAVGTQLSPTAAAAARERGLDVLEADLPDLPHPPGFFRVITIYHVVEHVPDPAAFLSAARRLLADGGLLVVEVPNHGGAGFRLLGERHLCFDFPNHLHFFTRRSLRALLERTGFLPVEESRFSLEYAPFTTLQNILNLLPGPPNRLYRSLSSNEEGRRLRREPLTWAHLLLGGILAPAALALSLAPLAGAEGNTLRVWCRAGSGDGSSPRAVAPGSPFP